MSGKHFDLICDFPKDDRPVYHEGLGHDEPDPDVQHGMRRIVGRLPYQGYNRERAEAEFKAKGIKSEIVFPTARFWCAAVYE